MRAHRIISRTVAKARKLRKIELPIQPPIGFNAQYLWSCDVDDSTVEELVKITKLHMKTMYDDAGGTWTWKDENKAEELRHEDARLVILRVNTTQKIAAFLHVRFDLEYDVPVAYIYELQVLSEYRNAKLGTYLMSSVEMLCETMTSVRLLMLTVFTANKPARAFYEKLTYEVDACSPVGEPYMIYSKIIDD